MDFIERFFGVALDGGSGSLELLLIEGFIALVAAFIIRWQFLLDSRRDYDPNFKRLL